MRYNFDFLKKEEKYKNFAAACLEAEKSLKISYSTTAILSRRALEVAVKWLYSYDNDLKAPYQDNLASLIHDSNFKEIIDVKLLPLIKFVQKLGNKAAHTSSNITREQAVVSLQNLFEFTSWIDYCYSTDYDEELKFDENLLSDSEEEEKTKAELQELYEKLGAKDRKLEEIIKENEELRLANAGMRENNKKNREFKVDEISEFKTRKIYIDLELELAGWTIGDNCIEEVEVEGMTNNPSGKGAADYVLFGDDGNPLAVIEAKKTSVDPRLGQVQAKLYADCLEKKYKVRPVIFYTNGFEYYMWDDACYPERIVAGIYNKEDLVALHYKRKNKKELKNLEINSNITDRYYQKEAITAVCKELESGGRKALLVMATGTGKTRTAISIVDVLIKNDWIKNILFLADRTALVKQAKKNFNNLLPELTLCNLLDNKDDPESRMIFSTYPTMMNAIDEVKRKDGKKLFTPGHFDLIIIDESHRSIYKKYQDIFNYFDGILLGLTATPKNELDKNTYTIFDLEDGVPTYAYELDQAIEDKYLVPYHTIESETKLMKDGIHYDDLSEEEKEHFEDVFDEFVKDIDGDALNSQLFNKDTVDKILQELMSKGLKVEGGDKLGKTIIFAKNKKHAEFIVERFNKLYPNYKGNFAKAVYTGIKFVESTMDDFEVKDKLPQIAVSVDMLDTGIDIPEVLNLVFFKKIRSKTKFWQMIGRGTRLCKDLYGIGQDKDSFRIFDYCGNFDFFRANKNGKEAKITKSLTETLFNIKISIIKELQNLEYQEDKFIEYRNNLIKDIKKEIEKIDETKFNARMKLKYIHKFKQENAFEVLSNVDVKELEDNVAILVLAIEDDELAKRFDSLMYTIEYLELRQLSSTNFKKRVVVTAQKLSTKGTIAQIKQHEKLIKEIQTDKYWSEADIFDYEKLRETLRDLIKYIDRESGKIYYTNFTDEILEARENPGEFIVNDMENYKKKVDNYLKNHYEELAIYKLRNNLKLTKSDIKYFENLLWKELGSKEDYKKEFGDEPLLKLVSKVVGLDREATNNLFSKFISDESLNADQIKFVKLVIDHIVKNGSLDKNLLRDYPFNSYGSIFTLFENKTIMQIGNFIDSVNNRLNSYIN